MKSKFERVQKLRGCGTDLEHLFRILSTMATAAYELPDTKIVDIGADRFRIPEAMFNPTIIEVTFGTSFLAIKPFCHKYAPAFVIHSAPIVICTNSL